MNTAVDWPLIAACLAGIVLALIAVFSRPRLRLWQVFALITLVGCLIGLGRWLVRTARETAVELSCRGRILQTAYATREWLWVHGTYLPQSTLDAQGQPIRWSDLMPQLLGDRQADGKEFLAEQLHCSCGAQYLLAAGPGAIVQNPALTPDTIRDGAANTLMAIEVANPPAQQAASGELTLAALDSVFADGTVAATHIHPTGRALVFADGALYRQLKPLTVGQLRSLVTVDGGESLTRAQLEEEGYVECLSEGRLK